MTINEAFVLPSPQDIRALEFVVRLRESEASADERLLRDYVITPAVEKELPRILDEMKQVFDRGEEYGRFIHGSFGSGKSHFMTMLSLLLEHGAPAWQKFGPLFIAHKEQLLGKGREAADHHAWLATANLLVVRIHMLSVRGKSTSFDRAVYEGFNQALKRRGKQPFEFLNVESIFEEVRREADTYGDLVWKQLETQGIVGSRAEFETIAGGASLARERFAREWLGFKGRSAEDAGIDPRWSEGLLEMARHAKGQGFGGIVLMIDEFLLWLSEKSGPEFAREINSLNVIVDHNTGQRAAPIFVFVARQRNPQEFFPDLVDESKIHEHIDHHSKRFEITKLQDVELRHIVKGRVLRPRQAADIQAAVDSLSEKNRKTLPALLAGADLGYLRDVYPFHPALIEMLVDVTALMQRERSALRLLYELLVLHNPDLPLGEFLPVGSAFPAIFPEAGVEASKKVELMNDIHHQYYLRLRPAIQQMAEAPGSELTEERRHALDQLVKTVLLAEVSPRLKQGGLTLERLVQLNSVDIEGETFRGQVRVAEVDLLALSGPVPDLQIAGQGKTAIVRYILGRVSLSEVLGRARSKVDNVAQRFKVFWGGLRRALGVDKLKGFEDGGPNQGDWELVWRHTRRRGSLKLGNVREMAYEDFEPNNGDYRILVDYPWDEPGHGVDEDRLKAQNVRKKLGNRYTVCWLPRHMTPQELGVITELAAVRHLQSEPGQELIETLNATDRTRLLEQARIREENLEGQLEGLLKEVYIHHGEFTALISDVDGSRPRETLAENLEHIATLLLDRRFPQHPHFPVEPKKADLELLLNWMVQAGEVNISVGYDDATGKALRGLGQALELVNLGQSKASLRLDSRYIKDVLHRVDTDSVSWTPIADHLRDNYGLQQLVIDLFLCFICQRDHRSLNENTLEPVEVKIGMSPAVRVKLQRARLVSPAEWSRLRDLGEALFGTRPPASRSLQIQDRFATELRSHGNRHRQQLQGLHERLVRLGIDQGERIADLALCNERLAPLVVSTTDSHQILAALLQQWPDQQTDPLRSLVRKVPDLLEAVAELSESAKKNLEAGCHHEVAGGEARQHLEDLQAMLRGPENQQPVTLARVKEWNAQAQRVIQKLIERPAPPPPAAEVAPHDIPKPQTPAPRSRSVLLTASVNTGDGDEISSFLAMVRQAIQQAGPAKISLSLVCEEEIQ